MARCLIAMLVMMLLTRMKSPAMLMADMTLEQQERVFAALEDLDKSRECDDIIDESTFVGTLEAEAEQDTEAMESILAIHDRVVIDRAAAGRVTKTRNGLKNRGKRPCP